MRSAFKLRRPLEMRTLLLGETSPLRGRSSFRQNVSLSSPSSSPTQENQHGFSLASKVSTVNLFCAKEAFILPTFLLCLQGKTLEFYTASEYFFPRDIISLFFYK